MLYCWRWWCLRNLPLRPAASCCTTVGFSCCPTIGHQLAARTSATMSVARPMAVSASAVPPDSGATWPAEETLVPRSAGRCTGTGALYGRRCRWRPAPLRCDGPSSSARRPECGRLGKERAERALPAPGFGRGSITERVRGRTGIVKTCGLACHDEVARSVAGRGRSCRSDQELSLTIRSVAGTQPVTNGWRDCPGMRRTTTALPLGILASRSQRSCVWHPKADSPERCSMRAAGPARTLFTSPRWDCRSWALTWPRRHWRSPVPVLARTPSVRKS